MLAIESIKQKRLAQLLPSAQMHYNANIGIIGFQSRMRDSQAEPHKTGFT